MDGMSVMQINLQCPINQLGYGVVGLNMVKALQNLDVDVSLFPIGNVEVTNQEDANAIQKAINRQEHFNPVAPCVKIWHEHALLDHIGKGRYFGFPIFELDDFNPIRMKNLECCDELIVCSPWARDVISSRTGRRSHVVPLGVDRTIFKDNGLNGKEDKLVFLNVGKWEIRKGHDVILKAFKEAFKEDEKVVLAMMCTNPFPVAKASSDLFESQYKEDPRVVLIPRAPTQQHLADIMRSADVGVFPSRAEGWNLELLEMMSLGKQVIATNYSGHTAFANKDNCHLIDVQRKTVAFDGVWFNGSYGQWASLGREEIAQLAKSMRDIYSQYSNGSNLFNVEGIKTAEEFSWDFAAKQLIEAVFYAE